MKMASTPRRLLATSLCVLLVSCSATRAAVPHPTSAQELSRRVLILEQMPDGQLSHAWEPLSGFDLTRYPYRASHSTVQAPIVRAAWNRDCEDERNDCETMCKQSLRGRSWSHASKGSKEQHCRGKCRPAYLDCCRLREQGEALEFSAVDEAVGWLKQHHEDLLVGTVVVIAGVAFVAVAVGSGGAALVLVPAVLLVSSEVPSEPPLAAVKP